MFDEDYVELQDYMNDFSLDYIIHIPRSGIFGFKIKVIKNTEEISKKKFKNVFELYTYLLKFGKNIDFITVKLDQSPLAPTILNNVYSDYLENNLTYISFSGKGFGLKELLIEVFGKDCIYRLNINKEPILQNNNLNGHILDNSKVYWPNLEEIRHYLISNFDLLYSRPATINIDTSSECNYSCIKCLYHSNKSPFRVQKKNQIQIEYETFKTIIDKVYAELGNSVSITPAIRGECLLNKSIIPMLEYAGKKGFDVSLFTNGQYCTPDIFRTLMKVGVKWINFSIDSIEKNVYEKLHKERNFKSIIRNVEQAIKIKGHNYYPIIGVHFVEQPENEGSFKDYFQYWSEKVDYIFHSSLCDVTNDFKSFKPPMTLPYRYPCFNLWSHLNIDGEGRCFICGIWNQKGYRTRYIFEETISNLWNSDFFRLARNMQFEPNLDEGLEFCEKCPSWAGNYSYSYRENNFLIEKSMCGTAYRKTYINSRVDNTSVMIKNFLNKIGINDNKLVLPAKIYQRIKKRSKA